MSTQPIPDFPGYEITRDGQVYSHKSKKWLKTYTIPNGKHQRYVAICLQRNRVGCHVFIHRLVAMTYAPNSDAANLEVNHKDANRSNNYIDNLEWCTRAENLWHRDNVTQSTARGSKHPSALLCEADVTAIRAETRRRGLIAELSSDYGVSEAMIKYLRYDHTRWKHVA